MFMVTLTSHLKEGMEQKPMAKRNIAGKLRGRVQIGVRTDGRPINKYVCAETEEELKAKQEEIRNQFVTGKSALRNVPFWQYADEWYKVRKEPFISPATRKTYKTMLNKYILPAFGERYMRSITATELQVFMNQFSGSSKSQITIAKATLTTIFCQAYAEGILDRNPACSLVRPKPGKSRKRRALTKEEVAGVMEAIQKNEHGLFLAVLYYLGVREGHIVDAQRQSFHQQRIVHHRIVVRTHKT